MAVSVRSIAGTSPRDRTGRRGRGARARGARGVAAARPVAGRERAHDEGPPMSSSKPAPSVTQPASAPAGSTARPVAPPAAPPMPRPPQPAGSTARPVAPPVAPPIAAPPVASPVAPPAMFRAPAGAAGDGAGAEEAGAARAVEIAAMLGDSVIGVKHCIDPRSGTVSPATWAVIAGGAACLVASAIAFSASVARAAENHARLETWTRVEHRPAYAFRPRDPGPAADWVAFGGFGLALVGLSLGAVRMRRERTSPYYRIGTAPGVDLAIQDAPAPAFPLVAPSGDDFVFHFAPGIEGELLQGGAATPLAALAAAGKARPSASTPGAIEVPIPRNARIRARAGRATFLIAAVPRPRRHAVPLLAGLERRALAYVAGSLAVHLAIWAVLQQIPPDAAGINVDLPGSEPIVARIQDAAPDDRVPPPAEQPGDGGGDPGSVAMPLPSGASGDPAAATAGRLQIADTGRPPQRSRDEAIADARSAGLLGNELLASAVDSLAERPDIASGFDAETFRGPLVGAYGNGPGVFGAGRTGFGAGGGCREEPCGLIPGGGGDGDGRYPTIGSGPGAGGGYGLPGRGFGPHGRTPRPPVIGRPEVSGGAGYDKTIIRRYIRRNIDKIGFCYDRELLAHPDIAGEVTVTFFISPSGAVQSSTGQGFDPEVAGCVAGVIKAIAFPRPGDGVGVQVNYPFQFHAAGR